MSGRLAIIIILLILSSTAWGQSIPNYKKPLLVSHLSGTQKTMLYRAGAPKHNAIGKVICFKYACRGVIGWTRTQQRNKFKKYKKPGIPRLQYLERDSLRRTQPKAQPAPVTQDTVSTIAAEPAPKDTTIMFVFDEVLFDTNSSDLKASFTNKLDSLSELIRKYNNYSIRIIGHTDNSGTERNNATLSKERAEAVASYLASTGINDTVMTAEGRGSREPIAENSNAAGRQKNRRVEIYLSYH